MAVSNLTASWWRFLTPVLAQTTGIFNTSATYRVDEPLAYAVWTNPTFKSRFKCLNTVSKNNAMRVAILSPSNNANWSSASLEGKPKPVKPVGVSKAPPGQDSEFIKELVETGRPDWKKAPAAVKRRYNGIFLILFSIPILFLSSAELYRRLEGRSTKKVQQGELLENREIRKFDEVEKWTTEKNSLMYRLFGRDFFLDGFTSKTMPRPTDKDKESK